MKKLVIEALAVRELSHIYSDKQYKNYYRQLTREGSGGNAYLMAMAIFDLFIYNAPAG